MHANIKCTTDNTARNNRGKCSFKFNSSYLFGEQLYLTQKNATLIFYFTEVSYLVIYYLHLNILCCYADKI